MPILCRVSIIWANILGDQFKPKISLSPANFSPTQFQPIFPSSALLLNLSISCAALLRWLQKQNKDYILFLFKLLNICACCSPKIVCYVPSKSFCKFKLFCFDDCGANLNKSQVVLCCWLETKRLIRRVCSLPQNTQHTFATWRNTWPVVSSLSKHAWLLRFLEKVTLL